MAEEGYHRREDGHESTDLGERDRMWAHVVHDPSRGSAWTSHKITDNEIDQLQSYFSKVLELLETLLNDSHRQWEGLAVVVRSLGYRVLAVWVSKEVRVRSKLDYDSEVFPIVEDHIVLRLRSEMDYTKVKNGGPWFVADQLLAMDAWKPDFIPGRKPIQKTVMWLHLLELPLDYWLSKVIMAVVAEASRLLFIDDYTYLL